MINRAAASTRSRKHIPSDVSVASPIAIPNEKTMQPFVAVYNPMIKQLKNLYKENRELTKLRDWLSPMLMNGQAIVK